MFRWMEPRWIERAWYLPKVHPLLALLLPLSAIFRAIVQHRYRRFVQMPPAALSVPVLVIGNITVGGTGKSPLTMAVVRHLQQQGWRPAILSRGYGGTPPELPLLLSDKTSPEFAGDEPVMLYRQLRVPVVVDPERVRGATFALDRKLADILICDDGLQHHRLARDVELCVLDARRGLGNAHVLPAGPLREPPERLRKVDLIVSNGGEVSAVPSGLRQFSMRLVPLCFRHLQTGATQPVSFFKGQSVVAMAGIGHPERFFDTLRGLGCEVEALAFPDHHAFQRSEFRELQRPVIVTAKDAVKCAAFAPTNTWVLDVEAQLSEAFWEALDSKILAAGKGQPTPATTAAHPLR